MKIIQVSTFFDPVVGGVEVQVKEIAKRLIQAGHEVEVFATDSDRNGRRISIKNSIVDGIKVSRFRTWFSLSQFYKFAPGIFFALLKTDFDIVHVHGFRKFEVYMALLACKIRKKKIIVTTHNPFTANTRSKLLDFFVNLHDISFGKLFSNKIDHVIALLTDEVEILAQKFKISQNKISVIPNGIDDIFYQDNFYDRKAVLDDLLINLSQYQYILNKNWKGVVLAVTRLNYVKGLQNLELAVKKIPDILFLFVGGDDGYLSELKLIYDKYSNVVITGKYYPHSEIVQLMSVSDLFVLPSLHEPFGLTPIEAAAVGLPVLATNVGGPRLILGDPYGEFLNPNDQEAWANAISNSFKNKNILEQKKNKGKIVAEKYRWEKVIEKILDVYKQL